MLAFSLCVPKSGAPAYVTAGAQPTQIHFPTPPLDAVVPLGLAAIVIAFALGSIPFGYLLGRFVFRSDIRNSGSGNIGAANVARTYGRGAGALIFALDALKGWVPVVVTTALLLALEVLRTCGPATIARSGTDVRTWFAAGAGVAAVLGHCFSPWLRFRGGKGVATAIGAIAAFSPVAGLIAVATWALGARITGYSSVGSIAAVGLAPLWLGLITGDFAVIGFSLVLAALVVYTHRTNIARLTRGAEHRLRSTD